MKYLKEFFEFVPSENIFEEEIKKGVSGDPYEYKKDGEKYYARKKGTTSWVLASGSQSKAIKDKIFSSKSPVEFKKTNYRNNPYNLSQYSHDDVRYQRDTFAPYAQKTVRDVQSAEVKSQQLARGIVPMKKESGIKPHYRIFGDFLRARKDPITSSDFTKEELKAIKDLIVQSKSNLGPSAKNIDFPAVAGVQYGKLKTGEEKQTNIGMPKSVSYVLGNAQVSDKGNYYLVNDIYDFNNYYKTPEKYSLANSPSTIAEAFKKIFSGNLVQGVEEIASYYHKIGYKGIPVSIQIPKNLA